MSTSDFNPSPLSLAPQHSRAIAPPSVSLMQRLGPALGRRLRLLWYRCRFPRAQFGRACDARAGLHILVGPKGTLLIGNRCVLDRDLTIECQGRLDIGNRTIFGHHCTLAAVDFVTIGEDCLIAEMVSIRDHDHCFEDLHVPIREQGAVTAPVRIGRNVWLGAKVTVTRGVTIGDNCIVGANAVVTRDIPANAIAVGIPAKVIKMRATSNV